MRRPAGIILVALLTLLLIAVLVARALLAEDAPRRDGVCAGMSAVVVAVATSLLPLRRALRASNLSFLRAYFTGLGLRVALLALIGLGVWRATAWNLRAYLTAVALSYPLAMALEGWALSREFPRRAGTAQEETGARP